MFLVYDAENGEDFLIAVLHDKKVYHVKIEHVEDAYFRLQDGTIVHGLDEMIELFSVENKSILPCKLTNFVQGIFPPNSSIKFGHTNILHKVVQENCLDLLDTVLKNNSSPQINIKDSNGI